MRLTWPMLQEANIVVYHSWTSTTSQIASYDPQTRIVTLAGTVSDSVYDFIGGNRYRLLNVYDFSGATHDRRHQHRTGTLRPYPNKGQHEEQERGVTSDPNEMIPAGSFVFSPTTRRLLYRALPREGRRRGNEDTPIVLMVPAVGTILSIGGDDAMKANLTTTTTNVTVEHIALAHADSFLEEQCMANGCSGQSGFALGRYAAVVIAPHSTAITFRHCNVSHVGGYAMHIHGHTNQIVVDSAHVTDLGAGGIRIGEPQTPTGIAEMPTAVTVHNCVIHDGGYVVEAGVGVFILHAANVRVTHNRIHDLYYTGVSTGWTWGYLPTLNMNLLVAKNEIYNIGRGLLSDMGCIYNLGMSPGTLFDHNVCHDVQTFAYGGWGLYSDEGSSHITWANNIVYRTMCAPCNQHYGALRERHEQRFRLSRSHSWRACGSKQRLQWGPLRTCAIRPRIHFVLFLPSQHRVAPKRLRDALLPFHVHCLS